VALLEVTRSIPLQKADKYNLLLPCPVSTVDTISHTNHYCCCNSIHAKNLEDLRSIRFEGFGNYVGSMLR